MDNSKKTVCEGAVRKMICLVVIICIVLPLTGCRDGREIDSMAYVLAIGFDKGENGNVRFTFEFATPSKTSGGGGGDSDSEEGGEEGGGEGDSGGGGGGDPKGKNISKLKSDSVTTLEAKTLYLAINLVNEYISKKTNFSNTCLVVFSEEVAKEGIEKYMNEMRRGIEFRSDMNVAVSKCNAEEYIRNVKPILEGNASKFYDFLFSSHQLTGLSARTKLTGFYTAGEGNFEHLFASLVGVNDIDNSQDLSGDKSEGDLKTAGLIFPGNIPKVYGEKIETMGIALFDGNKMIGELNGEDTMMHLMVSGELKQATISIADPKHPEQYVSFDIQKRKNPERHITVLDDKAVIRQTIYLEADILGIQSGENYEEKDRLKELETEAERLLQTAIVDYCKKTINFGMDIDGFGKTVRQKMLTWDEWLKVDWTEKYRKAEFETQVDFQIKRTGLMLRSVPY